MNDIDFKLDDMFPIEKIAKRLSCDVRTIRPLFKDGTIKGILIGRTWYTSERFFQEYLIEQSNISESEKARAYENLKNNKVFNDFNLNE